MSGWIRPLGLALAAGLAACGNGVFVISVSSGVIVGEPLCHGSSGQFQLRNQDGLLVLVVITNATDIVVVSGGLGRCADLSADARVQVAGHQSSGRIVAGSITLE